MTLIVVIVRYGGGMFNDVLYLDGGFIFLRVFSDELCYEVI